MNTVDFEKYAKRGSHGHLIGIGGVSMSPLAEVLMGQGIEISGSDINESETVKHLRQLGIKVYIGHRAENIEGADFIVQTAAVHDENPEIAAAHAKGIPVFARTQAWGSLMREYDNALCIAGTHGKTTTTSMSTHILMEADRDPTVMIGGTLPLLHSGYRVGHGNTIVLESCEYYNSFLSFFPTIAVILNIDEDHLDFFSGIEDIKNSFRRFAELVPKDTGWVIANADDKNTVDALHGIERRVLTFGTSESADVRPDNIEVKDDGITNFDVVYKGEIFTDIELRVPGTHNIMNATAAAAAAMLLGVSGDAVKRGLSKFGGAGRRFEFKGTVNGADVYDDYAHHPSELKALFKAARQRGYKRLICAFQPHTYTRTKALFDQFVEELKQADIVYLTEIFAAREKNTIGISSKQLAEQIPNSVFCENFELLEKRLREIAEEGDIILTVGAGDIYKVGENICRAQ